jgi:predicted acylesterase/phospholipase RssA
VKVLVLGGGGSKASWALGGLKRLKESGWEPDRMYGVSSGALIGTMYAQGKLEECAEVYRTVTTEDILDKESESWEKVVAPFVPSGDILYDFAIDTDVAVWSARPLWNLIQKHVNVADVKIETRIGVVSMLNGRYYALRSEWYGLPHMNAMWQATILASACQPCLMPCVSSIVLGNVDLHIRTVGDGGVRRTIPLMDAYEEGVHEGDEVWVLSNGNPFVDGGEVPTDTIPGRLARLLDIMLSDNNRGDAEYATHLLRENGVTVNWFVPPAGIELGVGLEFIPELAVYLQEAGYKHMDEQLTRM